MNTIVPYLLAILLFLVPVRSVSATTDTAFTTVRLGTVESIAIKVGQSIGFDIGGLIMPFFTKDKELAVPNHQATAAFKSNISQYLTPQSYKDDGKHISWNVNENPITLESLYGAILKTDAEHSDHPETPDCVISTGVQKSDDVTFAPVDFQYAVENDAWLGLYQVNPNESGVVDQNRKPIHLASMNPNEDCKKNETGLSLLPVANDVTALSSFDKATAFIGGSMTTSIFTTITKIINGVLTKVQDYLHEPNPRQVILTEKKREPHYNCLGHDGGGPGSEMGDCSGEADKTGGWTSFMLPEKDKTPVVASSEQEYGIRIAYMGEKKFPATYDLKNQSEVYQKRAGCYAVPDTGNASYDNVQKTAALGGVLVDAVAAAAGISDNKAEATIGIDAECMPAVACSATPPTFTGSSSCKQCSPTLPSWIAESGTVPNNKLPDNLIKLVEQVAEKVGVPPASILTAMYHEGAFVNKQLTGNYQSGPFTGSDNWTDENVIKWSTCGQGMPNCSVETNTYALCNRDTNSGTDGTCGFAIVGTGQIPGWFWGNGGDYDPWHAAMLVDPTRTRETINPCNLQDSIAGTAWALKAFGGTPRGPAKCYGRDLVSTTFPSCSPSGWDDNKIVQSHVGMWVANLHWPDETSKQLFCPDNTMMPPPAGFAGNSVDPTYDVKKVLDPYKVFSCK